MEILSEWKKNELELIKRANELKLKKDVGKIKANELFELYGIYRVLIDLQLTKMPV